MPKIDEQSRQERLERIQRLLLRYPLGLREAEIAQRMGLPRRTINDYLWSAELSTKIYKEGVLWFAEPAAASITLRPVHLSPEQAVTLYLAARLLAKQQDKRNEAAESALLKLADALRSDTDVGREVYQAAQELASRPADASYSQVFATIVQGFVYKRLVRMVYRPLHGEPFECHFSPYLLEPSAVGYTTYVLGHSDPPGALRTRKLERIQEAELTRQTFEVPADFPGLEILRSAWSVIYGEELVEVKLRFTPGAAERVQETRWHPSQTIEPAADGGCIWTAQVADVTDMLPWVRGWGADVEVLGPEALRRALSGETKRMSRIYQVAALQTDSLLEQILRCWGKTGHTTHDFHPALFHMLDVGHVARTLLQPLASPRWRKVLAQALDADPDMLATWLPYFIAVHDIGKLSPAFQALNEDQLRRLQAEGFAFKPWRQDLDLHHSQASQVHIQDRTFAVSISEDFRRMWVDMAGGHHGYFRSRSSIKQASTILQQYEPAEWREVRDKADSILQDHFLPAGLYRLPDPSDVSAATMALTGFAILCDWLGSDQQIFEPMPDLDLETYAEVSRARARQAVEKAELLTSTLSDKPTTFASLFPDKRPPRPLQQAIDEVPQGLLDAPCLAIIEAPTGEGKTEAALALAHRLAQASGCDELYYALPTTATSNQMFQRIQEHLYDYLDLPAQVKLIHGQAFLVEDELRMELLDDGGKADRQTMLEWATAKKRAMVAPFGVGTVDQAELAALNVKHSALRLMGLAGKVLIFDEVHAYDTYMTTIVETLLRWLSALGTSVIILSATLPRSQRAALAEAYGGEWTATPKEMDAYPSLWVLRLGQPAHHATPRAQQPDRRITVRPLHLSDDAPEAKARWLLDAVAGGGCACWITNTVDRAQQTFEVLQSESPDGIDLMLLHARFPLEQRQELEQQLVSKYGPGGKRPEKGIVVGTQVLEQSLDLDFDVMVSDLAPVDLLLQRAGRLQRHKNERPPAYAEGATLWINTLAAADGTPDLRVDEYIYDAFLLRQTRQVLAECDEFRLPRDYRRLVEAVYGVTEDQVDESLAEAWQALQQKRSHAIKEAKQRLLPDPDPEWSFVSSAARLTFEEDETGAAWIVAQTRLGRESVNLIPLAREGDVARLYPTQETVALGRYAPREMQLQLLRRHLRVSRPEMVRAAKGQEMPELFKSARLRGYYPLWFVDGCAEFSTQWGKLLVRLDPNLGLVIRSEKTEKGA